MQIAGSLGNSPWEKCRSGHIDSQQFLLRLLYLPLCDLRPWSSLEQNQGDDVTLYD